MKRSNLGGAFFVVLCAWILVGAQGSVVINDPTVNDPNAINDGKYKLSASEQGLMDKYVLPAVRKKLAEEGCEEEISIAGRHQGAFTATGTQQTAVFYQFCQTGNGLGKAGLAIFDGNKVAANFVAPDAGWTVDAAVLPDINRNGLDELALYYSGGMHQGAGGTGVDIVEYSNGKIRGIGWYQADGFAEKGPQWAFKVTVNPGKTPLFFKEKYLGSASGKWRRSGQAVPLKLGEIIGVFEPAN